MAFFSKLTVGRLEGRSRSDLLVKITMKGEDVERCSRADLDIKIDVWQEL